MSSHWLGDAIVVSSWNLGIGCAVQLVRRLISQWAGDFEAKSELCRTSGQVTQLFIIFQAEKNVHHPKFGITM